MFGCGQVMKNDGRQPTKAGWWAAGRTTGGGLLTCGGEGSMGQVV